MEVTPTVLQQGRVRLKLRISENTPGQVLKQENGEALAIDKQEIETLVEVRSGETLALGGIFSQKNKTARDSVPLLGDIPVLGRLFRRDGKDNERRELVDLYYATDSGSTLSRFFMLNTFQVFDEDGFSIQGVPI